MKVSIWTFGWSPVYGPGSQQYWVKLRRLMQEGDLWSKCPWELVYVKHCHVTFSRLKRLAGFWMCRWAHRRVMKYRGCWITLTAPILLIWVPCWPVNAVPGVLQGLVAWRKGSANWRRWSWHPGDDSRWIDGSVETAFPLPDWLNCSSHESFHLWAGRSAFTSWRGKRRETGALSRINHLIRTILFWSHSEAMAVYAAMDPERLLPDTLHRLLGVLTQKYDGDITIIQIWVWRMCVCCLLIEPGTKSTVPCAGACRVARSVIWNQCRVEILLDQLLSRWSGNLLAGKASCRQKAIRVLRLYRRQIQWQFGDAKVRQASQHHFGRSSSPLVLPWSWDVHVPWRTRILMNCNCNR